MTDDDSDEPDLNELLAQAWERGFQSCQLRVANELLALLPKSVDSSNPYRDSATLHSDSDDTEES